MSLSERTALQIVTDRNGISLEALTNCLEDEEVGERVMPIFVAYFSAAVGKEESLPSLKIVYEGVMTPKTEKTADW